MTTELLFSNLLFLLGFSCRNYYFGNVHSVDLLLCVTAPVTNIVGTCESAVCVRIESGIESGVKIRIESSNRIFSTPMNINY